MFPTKESDAFIDNIIYLFFILLIINSFITFYSIYTFFELYVFHNLQGSKLDIKKKHFYKLD